MTMPVFSTSFPRYESTEPSRSRAEQVQHIMRECLFRDDEIVDGKPVCEPVVVDAILATYGLHPQRFEEYRGWIEFMSWQVFTDDFLVGKGGGMSFLKVPEDRHGELWCDHRVAAEFVGLCVAAGFASFLLPRSMWSSLPGGVPYIAVDKSKWLSDWDAGMSDDEDRIDPE